MFSAKEIGSILLVTIVLGFVVAFSKGITITAFLLGSLFVLITVFLNVSAKKITAYYFDSEIDAKIWGMKRFGFKPNKQLKKEFPTGIFIPLGLLIISFGTLKWLASLVFDVKPKIYRAAKRHGLYSFSEMTEYHIGLIAASGIIINLIIAVIAYFINLPDLSRLNIFYAFFNMLPFSDLDGNKILFGSIILWSFVAALTLIAVAYAFLL